MLSIKKLLFILPILFTIPSALAVELPDVSGLIGSIGSNVWNMLQNDMTVFFFTFIFFFILLYGIYAAALRKVKVFSEGDTLNRQGKLVAVAFAMLSSFAIFFVTREQGIRAFLNNILEPLGLFAGVLLGITVFSIIYFGFRNPSGEKNWKAAMAAAGLGMIVAGMITDSPGAVSWGWLLIIIAAIFALIGLFGGGIPGRRSPPPPPPPPPPQENKDDQITAHLNQIDSILVNLQNNYNDLIIACDEILQTNHDYHSGFVGSAPAPGTHPPTATQWGRALDDYRNFIHLSDRINQLFDEIANLSSPEREDLRNRLQQTLSNFRSLINNFSNYDNDFRVRLNSNQPPA